MADTDDLERHLRLLQLATDQQNADRDYELKKRELDLREEELRHARWFNPLFLGVVAASLTLFGNMLLSHQQQATALAQEHIKAQSNLILEAIKTGTPERAATNLDFFIDLGFIDDPNGRIKAYLAKRQNVPVLPAALQQALEQNNVRNIVHEILSAAGFGDAAVEVDVVDDPNISAVAKIGNGKRTVQVNATFLQAMNRDLKTNWGSAFVLAHEIGHILLGHFDHFGQEISEDRRRAMELEADQFSGKILCRLGATPNDLIVALANMPANQTAGLVPPIPQLDRRAVALAGCASSASK